MGKYFNEQTDAHIREFLSTSDPKEKNEIFNEGIRNAFEVLVESQIHVYRFFSLGDVETLKKDALSYLFEQLNAGKFDPNRGKKGFSYFNVVCRNWFIQKAREKSKRSKRDRELHVGVDSRSIRTNPAMTYSHHETKVLDREVWQSFFKELDFWRSKLVKKNEKKVLEAVIFLLNNPDLVDIYNKKAVYLYIREMTGLNEKQVAMVLKKLRDLYAKWKQSYYDDEG